MPVFRVTYRCVPGSRWLVEDVEADRHDIRSSWHVFARVTSVVGLPRWICALRVHDRDIWGVTRSDACEVASRRGETMASRRPGGQG